MPVQIVNVDIDSFVTQAATKPGPMICFSALPNVVRGAHGSQLALRWFPKVAAGLNDSRCEMLHLDAFSWVRVPTVAARELVCCPTTAQQSGLASMLLYRWRSSTKVADLPLTW